MPHPSTTVAMCQYKKCGSEAISRGFSKVLRMRGGRMPLGGTPLLYFQFYVHMGRELVGSEILPWDMVRIQYKPSLILAIIVIGSHSKVM